MTDYIKQRKLDIQGNVEEPSYVSKYDVATALEDGDQIAILRPMGNDYYKILKVDPTKVVNPNVVQSPTTVNNIKQIYAIRDNIGTLEYSLIDHPKQFKPIGGDNGLIIKEHGFGWIYGSPVLMKAHQQHTIALSTSTTTKEDLLKYTRANDFLIQAYLHVNFIDEANYTEGKDQLFPLEFTTSTGGSQMINVPNITGDEHTGTLNTVLPVKIKIEMGVKRVSFGATVYNINDTDIRINCFDVFGLFTRA